MKDRVLIVLHIRVDLKRVLSLLPLLFAIVLKEEENSWPQTTMNDVFYVFAGGSHGGQGGCKLSCSDIKAAHLSGRFRHPIGGQPV